MKMNDNRASQIESMLQNLPKTAEQGLSGLTAGPDLRTRIQLTAAEQKKPAARVTSSMLLRWASAACCALLVLAIGLGLTRQSGDPQQPEGLITSSTLGTETTEEPVLMADLGDTGVIIAAGNRNPGFRDMWAPSTGGSFPLIGIDGKYYRMLTTPRNVSSELRGSAIATISEFTTEPSLSGTDTVLSNAVSFGEKVYSVRGMGDSLVIAKVDGQMRLFQRVSFNGNALRGREKLEDTLQVRDHVIAMELTSVGTITDPEVCAELLELLYDCASYESSGSISSRQSLIFELDNGLVVQFAVKSDNVAACGVWSCPEFFEAFEEACD